MIVVKVLRRYKIVNVVVAVVEDIYTLSEI